MGALLAGRRLSHKVLKLAVVFLIALAVALIGTGLFMRFALYDFTVDARALGSRVELRERSDGMSPLLRIQNWWQHPKDGRHVLMLDGFGQVYKSANFGKRWHKVSGGPFVYAGWLENRAPQHFLLVDSELQIFVQEGDRQTPITSRRDELALLFQETSTDRQTHAPYPSFTGMRFRNTDFQVCDHRSSLRDGLELNFAQDCRHREGRTTTIWQRARDGEWEFYTEPLLSSPSAVGADGTSNSATNCTLSYVPVDGVVVESKQTNVRHVLAYDFERVSWPEQMILRNHEYLIVSNQGLHLGRLNQACEPIYPSSFWGWEDFTDSKNALHIWEGNTVQVLLPGIHSPLGVSVAQKPLQGARRILHHLGYDGRLQVPLVLVFLFMFAVIREQLYPGDFKSGLRHISRAFGRARKTNSEGKPR